LDWKIKPATFKWLYGKPGCGKTILSSSVIENLVDQQHVQGKFSMAVAYFYFDFKDPSKQQSELMVKSLLSQLSQHCLRIGSKVQSIFDSLKEKQHPSLDDLLSALQELIRSSISVLGGIYLVLDALDECSDRSELLRIIGEFRTWNLLDLHILMTSRREIEIEDALMSFMDTADFLCLQTQVVNGDITLYVRERLSNDRKLRKWNTPHIREEIETAMMEKADGM
jgi:NACHT domain-containing protein